MIRLGHIDYSNCIPVHALLLERRQPGVELVPDVPSALNRALAAGSIDAAPCSSIEYARHAGEYRILPAHAIGSAGPVHSILLETAEPLASFDGLGSQPERRTGFRNGLDGRVVAVPTASATSVVLLRILLEIRLGVRPEYVWFDQTAPADPLADGAAAVLRIGDTALRRTTPPGRSVFDLGAEWHAWTGLPFAFAVWQVRRDVGAAAIDRLAGLLAESRAFFSSRDAVLADRYAARYGLAADRLLMYWRGLHYDLDASMQRGLLRFYEYAAELGEAPACDALDVVVPGGS